MAEYFLIAGLGNPSAKYENTRHNAGFWFVDKIAAEERIEFTSESRFSGLIAKFVCGDRTALLLKPLTFMNRSGLAVGAVSRYFKIAPENILVAHDDLDFDAGTARLKMGGGHGGHNGLRDIIANLGVKSFLRLRIGISHPGDRSQVLNYVLGNPSLEDRLAIERAIGYSVGLLPEIMSGGIAGAMNLLHAI